MNSGVADQDIRLIVCTGSSTLEEVRRLQMLRTACFCAFCSMLAAQQYTICIPLLSLKMT